MRLWEISLFLLVIVIAALGVNAELKAERHALKVENMLFKVANGDPSSPNPEDRKTLRQFLADRADNDIKESEKNILAEVSEWRKTSDSRLDKIQSGVLGEWRTTLRTVNETTLQGLKLADTNLESIAKDVHSVSQSTAAALDEVKSTAKDAHESWDDMYWDVKAAVGSADVAATSVAQTAEVIRDGTPKMVASANNITSSVAGVASDVKREADVITAPKKWYQKLLGPVYTLGRLVAAFL